MGEGGSVVGWRWRRKQMMKPRDALYRSRCRSLWISDVWSDPWTPTVYGELIQMNVNVHVNENTPLVFNCLILDVQFIILRLMLKDSILLSPLWDVCFIFNNPRMYAQARPKAAALCLNALKAHIPHKPRSSNNQIHYYFKTH